MADTNNMVMQEKVFVILVDEADRPLGIAEKMHAHRDGLLHRAVSVFVFNSQGALLLQRRAAGKYHSGGLWTNTCCTHPYPREATATAAMRRLEEEMGMACPLEYRFTFIYKAGVSADLVEHELDHVFFGVSDILPLPDPEEVSEYRYQSLPELETALLLYPEQYTVWFRLIFEQVKKQYNDYVA